MSAVILHSVTKALGNRVVLDGVSLALPAEAGNPRSADAAVGTAYPRAR